jgi:uncharacterized membrane protein
MTGESWGTLAGLLITFITALLGYLQSRRNAGKIMEVHVLVNSQLADTVARVGQLTDTLTGAGVEIPDAPKSSAP